MTRVELVRHAQAYARSRWRGGPDDERPLDDHGQTQAEALAKALDSQPIVALYTSPTTRCRQTLQPLAERLGLRVHDADDLAEADTLPVLDRGDAWVASAWLAGRALRFLDRILDAHADQVVVACSHGDVIPALAAALVGRDRLPLADVGCAKGGRFTLTFDGRRCVEAVAMPPPT